MHDIAIHFEGLRNFVNKFQRAVVETKSVERITRAGYGKHLLIKVEDHHINDVRNIFIQEIFVCEEDQIINHVVVVDKEELRLRDICGTNMDPFIRDYLKMHIIIDMVRKRVPDHYSNEPERDNMSTREGEQFLKAHFDKMSVEAGLREVSTVLTSLTNMDNEVAIQILLDLVTDNIFNRIKGKI